MERTPMQRYEDATGPDGWLTANGWERLAADIDHAADSIWGAIEASVDMAPGHASALQGRAQKLRDRAADCRARRLRLIVAYEKTLPGNGY